MSSAHVETEQEIRQIVQRWFDAENQKDIEATMGFMSNDMIIQAPGMPQMEGETATREFFAGFFGSPLVSIGGGTAKVEVSEGGDMAYGIGPNRVVMISPDGSEVTEEGKWFIVWKKQHGRWKAVAASFSGDKASK